MEDLIAFTLAQIARDEQVAREASGDEFGRGRTPTGEHWHWVDPQDDTVLTLDPVAEDYVGDGSAHLRSVETYPARTEGWMLPHFVVRAEEIRTVDAMHITAWDPARVLPLMAALRKILDGFSWEAGETRAVAALAEALYSGRPGWDPNWIAGL